MQTIRLDALGLLCPLPVLKARKRLKSMNNGEILELHADDPAAIIDVPHYCTEAGHSFLGSEDLGNGQLYRIQKR